MSRTTLKGEAAVKKACEDLLKAERLRYWRMNSGDRFGSTNGRKWRIRGHEKGTPDLLVAAWVGLSDISGSPEFLWIETKVSGGKLSAEQLQFAVAARENGEHCLLVDDVTILQNWLKENRTR